MVSPVRIRVALPEDASALAVLTGELGYPVAASAMEARLEEVAGDPHHGVFVADAGSIAGWIHVALVLTLESGRYAEIRGLVVGRAYRRDGIGRRLVAAAEEWARCTECSRVRVRTNIVREEAPRFYTALGYELSKTQAVFDKRV